MFSCPASLYQQQTVVGTRGPWIVHHRGQGRADPCATAPARPSQPTSGSLYSRQAECPLGSMFPATGHGGCACVGVAGNGELLVREMSNSYHVTNARCRPTDLEASPDRGWQVTAALDSLLVFDQGRQVVACEASVEVSPALGECDALRTKHLKGFALSSGSVQRNPSATRPSRASTPWAFAH